MSDPTRKLTKLESVRMMLNGNTGDLSGLNTADKNTLVDAINELNAGVGGIVDDDVISSITAWSSFTTSLRIAQAIADLIDSAPETLDTLREIAEALGNDPNFATTITNMLALKAPINNPTFTGSVTLPPGTIPNVPDATTTVAGIVKRATASEVSAGIEDSHYVTPAGLRIEIKRLEDRINSYHP